MNLTQVIFLVALCIASSAAQQYWKEMEHEITKIDNAIYNIRNLIKMTLVADENQDAVMLINHTMDSVVIRAKDITVQLAQKVNNRSLNQTDLLNAYDNLSEILHAAQQHTRNLLKQIFHERALLVKGHFARGEHDFTIYVLRISRLINLASGL